MYLTIPTKKEWDAIFETKWTSADQHQWEGKEIFNAKKDLGKFYQSYAGLKKCYEARKGYLAVNVNSVAMANYKSKAKSIENGIFNKYPDIKPMVETHLTNQDVNGRFIDFLQGHSQKGIGGSVYMKGIKMNVLLKDCVERIKWDMNWRKLKVKW